jgi:hypothetical protein
MKSRRAALAIAAREREHAAQAPPRGGEKTGERRFTRRFKPDKLNPRMKTKAYRDPVVDAYMPGVDRTLLRENLKLTYEERIQNLTAPCK